MAAGKKLVLVFKTSDGENISFSYNYISSEITQTQITNLMNGLITNGTIFAKVPATKVSAKIVTQTEENYAIE